MTWFRAVAAGSRVAQVAGMPPGPTSQPRPRVLFVDDCAFARRALARVLSLHGERLEAHFADGAAAALAELERGTFDAVVSDLAMAPVDGAALLTAVQLRWPDTLRFVLSGDADAAGTQNAVPVAHQFYAKPLDVPRLLAGLDRALAARRQLAAPAVRSLLGRTQRLPSAPRTYHALTRALADVEVSLAEVARIVEQDPGVAARLLAIAGSPLFGTGGRIRTVRAATTYLGLAQVQSVVLSVEVFRTFASAVRRSGLSLDDLQAHALRVALIARALAPRSLADDAHLAGLLHEVGRLVLASRDPVAYGGLVRASEGSARRLTELERAAYGATHAEVGAALLASWGLPSAVVEAVAHHVTPAVVDERTAALTAAVSVADRMDARTFDLAGAPVDPADEWLAARLDPEGVVRAGVERDRIAALSTPP